MHRQASANPSFARPRRRWLFALLAPALTISAPAQMGGLILEDATILVGDGTRIEKGKLLVTGDKFVAIGRDVQAPLMSRTVSAEGKVITPGLIDAWSSLAIEQDAGPISPLGRAADAVNSYDADAIRAALAQGVTMAYVPARGVDGVAGAGAIIRLSPDGPRLAKVVNADAALCATLGATPEGPIARLKAARDLRKAFREAREYRKIWEDYEEELKEYEEALAKRPKDLERKDKSPETQPAEKTEPAQSGEERRPRRRRPRGADEGDAAWLLAPGAANAPQPSGDAGDKQSKPAEELKKPAEPRKERDKERLLDAMDGKLRFRVHAERPEDILNLLSIADEFSLALALEGASGAARIANELARREIPVILSAAPPSLQFTPGPTREQRSDDAATLLKAGARVLLGSGDEREAGPYLALAAARMVGFGLPADRALKMITSDAAELLGVSEDYGMIESGRTADFVIWDGDPLDPTSRVEAVFVGGVEVYHAEGAP